MSNRIKASVRPHLGLRVSEYASPPLYRVALYGPHGAYLEYHMTKIGTWRLTCSGPSIPVVQKDGEFIIRMDLQGTNRAFNPKATREEVSEMYGKSKKMPKKGKKGC